MSLTAKHTHTENIIKQHHQCPTELATYVYHCPCSWPVSIHHTQLQHAPKTIRILYTHVHKHSGGGNSSCLQKVLRLWFDSTSELDHNWQVITNVLEGMGEHCVIEAIEEECLMW